MAILIAPYYRTALLHLPVDITSIRFVTMCRVPARFLAIGGSPSAPAIARYTLVVGVDVQPSESHV